MKSLFKNKLLKSWALYDFSNSSYVLIFQSFLLPVFFSTIIQGELGFSKFSWGLANGLSTFIGLLLAIMGGSFSDRKERLRVFKLFIYLTFFSIIIFSFSISKFPALSFYLYILTNAFFITTISLSDSLLKFIGKSENMNEYSGFAWGFGYLGGIICLLIVIVLQAVTSEFNILVFLFVALFYFIFSIVAFNGIKKHGSKIEFNPSKEEKIEKKAITTSEKVLLLSGYWLISESITVIILFYSIFASEELHLSSQIIGATLLFVQLIGFFSTWFGGKLADKYGNLKILGFSIISWIIVIVLLITTNNFYSLVFIVIFTGLGIGNSQSLLRAQFAQLVDKYNIGLQFGLFAIATQAAVIIGPIFHGYLSDLFGSQKIPMAFLISFLIIGFLIILYVNQKLIKRSATKNIVHLADSTKFQDDSNK